MNHQFVFIISTIANFFNLSYAANNIAPILLITLYVKKLRLISLFILLSFLLSYFNLPDYLIQTTELIHQPLYQSYQLSLEQYFNNNISALIVSITAGNENIKIPSNIYSLFKDFNLLHLISISGSNFILLEELIKPSKRYIKKNKRLFIYLVISSLYILLIGINNLPALRAYLFGCLNIYSQYVGRPIKFLNKSAVSAFIISLIHPKELISLSLLLSYGFTFFYKLLLSSKINKVLNNELKILSVVFLASSFIFNSSKPDFLANILLTTTYPLIFFAAIITYLLDLIKANPYLLTYAIEGIINLIINGLNQLSTNTMTLIQNTIFIAILASMLKRVLNTKQYVHS